MITAERREYELGAGSTAALTFVSALDTAQPWNDPAALLAPYDGLIIGGSGEFDLHGGRDESDRARATALAILERLRPLVAYVLESQKPVLGVCFGHQLIAEMQGGKVISDPEQKKVGSFEVGLTTDGASDHIFSTLPKTFFAQYGHKDSVTVLPKGAVLLASSPMCRFSALKYGTSVYTVQFHPELDRKGVLWRLENSPGYLPEGIKAESLVKESPEASTIIASFIEKVVA